MRLICNLLFILVFSENRPAQAAPMRVATCAVAGDEMVADLLTRAGHLERLIAVSTLADDPRYSNLEKLPPRVAGRCGGELEALLRLKPDLAIVAAFNKPELLRRLGDARIATSALRDFVALDDVEKALGQLGDALGEKGAATEAIAAFRKERQALDARLGAPALPKKVLEYFPGGVVAGAQTFFDDLTRAAGAVNVASAIGLVGWPRAQAEKLATLRPDALVAAGDEADRARLLQALRAEPGLREIPAVKEGKLILIPERELSAASPYILKALARLRSGLEGLDRAK